jgi:lipopolysaccharide/colanic/teichoic acid biosynthesis glycosyltransferase
LLKELLTWTLNIYLKPAIILTAKLRRLGGTKEVGSSEESVLMRVPFPTSRGAFRFRFRVSDVVLAFISPFLALYLSNAYALASSIGLWDVAIYCSISIVCAGIAFLMFRTENGILQHFSVYEVLRLSKAVVTAELVTCVVAFTVTRLDGIPRSAPIIQALILLTGLVSVRIISSIAAKQPLSHRSSYTTPEYVILVSSSALSALYIKLLQTQEFGNRRVVSVLDADPRMIGRSIEGVPIVGTPEHLEAVIREYQVHGIQIDRVVFGEKSENLPHELVEQAILVCEREQICLDFLPQLLGLRETKLKQLSVSHSVENFMLPSYFRWKPLIDVTVATALTIVLLPLFLGTALIVLIDVGSPVLFWQRRVGARGRWFLLYKFRTLSSPINRMGELVPSEERLSRIGRLLRETSLDELPQIFNVLVGDMSLIGPRPLLPIDQPEDARMRLMVAPGITGWAQVNGRKSLTPEEKEQLDAWYVRNGSLKIDAQIVFRTFRLLMNGVSGSNKDTEIAHAVRSGAVDGWKNVGAAKIEQM